MIKTEQLTQEQKTTDLALIKQLRCIVNTFYWDLFHAKTGGHFHAFVEWCGIMNEHLNIAAQQIQNGEDFFNQNKHSGDAPKIPAHQLRYLAEKMECIFGGQIEIKVKDQ